MNGARVKCYTSVAVKGFQEHLGARHMLAYYGNKTEQKVSSDDPVKVTLFIWTFFSLFVFLAGESSHLMNTAWRLWLLGRVHLRLLCMFEKIMRSEFVP